MPYSFISLKAKEVEEMLLAESKNLTIRDFQTVVSESVLLFMCSRDGPTEIGSLKECAFPLLGLCNGVFIAQYIFCIILEYFFVKMETLLSVCAHMLRVCAVLNDKNKVDTIKT